MTSPEALKRALGTASRNTEQGRTGTPNGRGLSLVRLLPIFRPRRHRWRRGNPHPAFGHALPGGEAAMAMSRPSPGLRPPSPGGARGERGAPREALRGPGNLPTTDAAGAATTGAGTCQNEIERGKGKTSRSTPPGDVAQESGSLAVKPGSDHAPTRSATEGLACATAHVTQPALRVGLVRRSGSRPEISFRFAYFPRSIDPASEDYISARAALGRGGMGRGSGANPRDNGEFKPLTPHPQARSASSSRAWVAAADL